MKRKVGVAMQQQPTRQSPPAGPCATRFGDHYYTCARDRLVYLYIIPIYVVVFRIYFSNYYLLLFCSSTIRCCWSVTINMLYKKKKQHKKRNDYDENECGKKNYSRTPEKSAPIKIILFIYGKREKKSSVIFPKSSYCFYANNILYYINNSALDFRAVACGT